MAFLITKELIFDFQILDLTDHFSASLNRVNFVETHCMGLMSYGQTFNCFS